MELLRGSGHADPGMCPDQAQQFHLRPAHRRPGQVLPESAPYQPLDSDQQFGQFADFLFGVLDHALILDLNESYLSRAPTRPERLG